MQIDYYKWHDGIGYDIDIIRNASAAERAAIEDVLARRGAKDWRDVEAFAALGATGQLRKALASSDCTVSLAVLEYAPTVATEAEAVELLTRALHESEIGAGFAEALRIVTRFHPPAIVDAMLRAICKRKNTTLLVPHLLSIHGHVDDPSQFLSRFHGDQFPQAFRELCARIGVDASRYL